jgi:hypothetical protein
MSVDKKREQANNPESRNTGDTIEIVLETTLGTQAWDLTLPINIPVQALIARFLREPTLNFKPQDDAGNPIPYRIMWKEGSRYLRESETLQEAGIENHHTLIMTHEARAGKFIS